MASSTVLILLANIIILLNKVDCSLDYDYNEEDPAEGTVPPREQATERQPSATREGSSTRLKVFSTYGLDTHKLTWTEAYLFCKARDSSLATIENHQEYENLKTKLKSIPKVMTKDRRFWLGAARTSSFEWIWVDSGKLLTFSPWANKQPNIQGTCLELSSTKEPELYTKPCDKINNFICHSFITVKSPEASNKKRG